MLHWLPSGLYKVRTQRQSFLTDIILLVVAAHLIMIFSMIGFSGFNQQSTKYSVSMHQSGATYVLMPLQKKVFNVARGNTLGDNSLMRKKSQVINYETYQQQKKNQAGRAKVKNMRSQNSISGKDKIVSHGQKRTLAYRGTAMLVDGAAKKSKKKSVALKKTSKKQLKKNKTKIIEETDKNALSQVAQEIEPLKDTSAVQDVVKSDALPLELVDSSINTDAAITDPVMDVSLDNVVFVGYEQLDECMVSSKIQQAIAYHWAPPIGTARGTRATLCVTVDGQGCAQNVVVQESSGIYAYDTMARAALCNAEYPAEVFGKNIVVVLEN